MQAVEKSGPKIYAHSVIFKNVQKIYRLIDENPPNLVTQLPYPFT
jgi:hypothetical protein